MSNKPSQRDIEEERAKARSYGYGGVSRNKATLSNWNRLADYLYESSVKYLGWERKNKNFYDLKLKLEKLAKEDEIYYRYHTKSGSVDWEGIMTYILFIQKFRNITGTMTFIFLLKLMMKR